LLSYADFSKEPAKKKIKISLSEEAEWEGLFQEKKDAPQIHRNYQIKISDLQMILVHYDIPYKCLNIKVFMPDYDKIMHFEDLDSNLDFIVMDILGEIAYRRHI
jgi:hypothetical protein